MPPSQETGDTVNMGHYKTNKAVFEKKNILFYIVDPDLIPITSANSSF